MTPFCNRFTWSAFQSSFQSSWLCAACLLALGIAALYFQPVAAITRGYSDQQPFISQHGRFAADNPSSLEQSEQKEIDAYTVAVRRACALPAVDWSWQPMGTSAAVLPEEICKSNVASFARRRREWMARVKRDEPNFLNGSVGIQGKVPVWWASAGAAGWWRGTTNGARLVDATPTHFIAASTADAQVMYALREVGKLDRSTDGGASFVTAALPEDQAVLWLHQEDATHLLAGGRGLWRSTDGGERWQALPGKLMGTEANRISAMTAQGPVVWAATSEGWVQRFDETGSSFAALPRRGYITALAIDPHATNIIYAVYSTFGASHVWQSLDGGTTWSAIDGELPDVPVNAFAADPQQPGRLFAGTDLGVFITNDNGLHWSRTLPGLLITSLQVVDGQLYAFGNNEAGAGVWRASLAVAVAASRGTCIWEYASQLVFKLEGETLTTSFNAMGTCDWTATLDAAASSWVTIVNGASGQGNGSVTLRAARNTQSLLRTGSLILKDVTIPLFQEGTSNDCPITSLTPGVPLIGQITASDCNFLFHGQRWASDRYSFTGRQGEVVIPNVTLTANDGFGSYLLKSPDGSLVATASTSSNYFVLPQDGTYVIQVYSAIETQPLDYRVAVQVLSPGCESFAVTGLDRYFGANGGTGRIAVSMASNCAWQLLTSVPWVTFPNLNGRGSQIATFTVAENTAATSRTAKVFIGNQTIEIRQAGQGGDCEVRRLSLGNHRVRGTLTLGDCFQVAPQNYVQHVYEFDGLAGQRVTADLVMARIQSCKCSGGNGLTLRNARGSTLAASTRQISGLVLPEDGQYTLLVGSGDVPPVQSSDYTMAFTLAPAECTVLVTPEVQIAESAGGTARFNLQTPGHCPWQYQHQQSGTVAALASGLQGIGPTMLSIPVPASKEDYSRSFMSSVSGQQFSILQLAKNASCAATQVTPGVPVEARLRSSGCPSRLGSYPGVSPFLAGSSNRFTFSGEQGQVFTFSARPFSPPYPNLSPNFVAPAGYSLVDPQGELVAAGQTESWLSVPGIVLPKTGEYQFELAAAPIFSDDRYQLTVFLNATECATMASVSATKFDAAGGSGRLFIETAEGCPWEVEFATGATQFELDPKRTGTGRGLVEFSFRPNPSPSAVSVTLRVGRQTFTLEQAGQNGTCRPMTLPFDQFINGQILVGDCAVGKPPEGSYYTNREYGDVYTFHGNAGEQLALYAPRQISVSSPSGVPNYLLLRPTVKLYAPDGQLLTDALASRVLEGHYLLPQTGTYRVTVSPPTDNANITIGSFRDYQIMLERLTPGCIYSASNDLQLYDGAGGNGTYRITTASGCQWKPRASVAWLHPIAPANGTAATGSANGSFAVEANLGATTRVGSIAAGGRLIEVEQAGAGGKCVIETLAPNSTANGTAAASDCRARNSPFPADLYQFTTRLNNRIRLNVTSTVANAQFAVTVFDESWRQIVNSVYFPTGLWMSLPAGTYYLQVQGGPRESVTPYTISLDVSNGACDFALTPVEQRFTSAGGTGIINVITQPGCVWAATRGSNAFDQSWLTITEGGSGVGSGTIKYSVAPFDLIGGWRNGWIQLLEHRVAIGQSSATSPEAERCAPVSLTLDQPRTGFVENSDCNSWFFATPETTRADRFTFTAPAHRQFAIEVTSALPATLTLYDAQRRVIGQNAVGQSRIPAIAPNKTPTFIVLPDNQTYGIEIAANDARATFNYTIKLVTPAACAVNLRQLEPAQNQPTAAAGGGGLLQVIAPSGCQWDVTHLTNNVPPWLTFTTATTGTGNGTVGYRWAANESSNFRLVEFGGRILQQLVLGQLGVNGVCDPRAITAGQTVRGTLRNADCRQSLRPMVENASLTWEQANPPTHQFTFEATAGEQLALLQRRTDVNGINSGGSFTLFDPQGRVVGIPNVPHIPYSLVTTPLTKMTMPLTGTYTLEYSQTPGDYEFVLDVTAGGCGFLLESEEVHFGGTSGTGTVNVTTQGDCRWTAYAQETWIKITSGSGQGNGVIRFTVDENQSTQTRRGFIRLAGRGIAVTQSAQGGSCAATPIAPGQVLAGEITVRDCFRVNPDQSWRSQPTDRYIFNARAGEHAQVKVISGGALGVQILPASILRLSSAASDATTPLSQPRDWFGTASLTIPADGAYVIEVMSNTVQGLPLPYTIHLQLNASGCGVTFNAEAGAGAVQYDSAAATGSFTVTAPAGCRWEVYAVNDWITVEGTRERSGTGPVAFTITANPSNQARWGTIIAGGQVYLIEQAGAGEVPGTCTTAALAAGQTVFGNLSSADCRPRSTTAGLLVADRYRFTGTAGQRIYLLARFFTEPYLAHLSLFDSLGVLLAESAGSGMAKPLHTQLPDTGGFITLMNDGDYVVEIARRTEPKAPVSINYSLNLSSVPAGCSYSLNAQPLRFAATGGTGTVKVMTNAVCPWTVRGTENWITNEANTVTTGSGTMSFTVAPNLTNQSRRGMLLLGAHLVVVEQAGTSGSCAPQPLTPGQIANTKLDEADCSGYMRVADHNALPRYVERYTFSAQAGDRVAFTTTRKMTNNGYPIWLRLLNPAGAPLLTSTNGRLPAYNERSVLPVSGTYEIEISAEVASEFEYLLLLGSGGCELNASPSLAAFEPAGGSGTLTINTATESSCPWRAYSNAAWVTFENGGLQANGTGNASLRLNVAPNATAAPRTAFVAISDKLLRIEQAGSEGSCTTSTLMRNQFISGVFRAGACPPLEGSPYHTNFSYVQRYRFDGETGERLSFTINAMLAMNRAVILELFDAQGRIVAAQAGNRLPQGGEIVLPATGAYVLALNATEPGTFTLLASSSSTCSLTIAPTSITLPGAGGKRTVTVTPQPTGCSWAGRAASEWLALNGQVNLPNQVTPNWQLFNGARTLEISAIPNLGGTRLATLWLGDQVFSVKQEPRQFVTATESLVAMNAATMQIGEVAPDSLVSVFGRQLAMTTKVSATATATELGFTTVAITDAAQIQHRATLLFASPSQVNFVMPNNIAAGLATIEVTNGEGLITKGTVSIAPLAPGLFTLNATGSGLAAGVFYRVGQGLSGTYEALARFDQQRQSFVAMPIAVDAPAVKVYLVLYGTGLRRHSLQNPIIARVAGLDLPVQYAGSAYGTNVGIDQINLELPSALAGRGELVIELSAGDKRANAVRFAVK